MSRYELDPKPDTAGVSRAVVGWDRPLQTSFAQVFMASAEDDAEEEATIWEGTSLRELPSAAAALALVAPYAIVPAGLSSRLEEDQVRSMSRSDGPLQLGMKQIVFRPTTKN